MRLHDALSNDVQMPASEQTNGRGHLTDADQGVLANLPRTRPQRATRRRIASRERIPAEAETATAQGAGAATASAGPAAETGAAGPKRERSARGARQTRARAGTRGGATGRSGTRESSQGPRGARKPAGAKRSTASATASRGSGTRKQQRGTSSSRPPRTALELAPRQGFESESERPSGPVQPPGGAELVASAAEIVGEITKAGFAAGERLLRDALSRLPRS